MIVAIYKLAREFDWYEHLCDACLEIWLGRGWQVREKKDPPHGLVCAECGCGTFGGPIEAKAAA